MSSNKTYRRISYLLTNAPPDYSKRDKECSKCKRLPTSKDNKKSERVTQLQMSPISLRIGKMTEMKSRYLKK